MQPINSAIGLKEAIQLLETKKLQQENSLKEQFHFTLENIKPGKIIRNTFTDIITSPNLAENIIDITLGLVTGYLSKKIFVGTSASIVKKVLGSALQLGISEVVSKHPEGLKSLGRFIFRAIVPKNKAGIKDHE